MDEVFGYKAAFEAYITLRDDAETAKLKMFSDHLQEVENSLPMDESTRTRRSARWPQSASSMKYSQLATEHTASAPLPSTCQRRTRSPRIRL